MSRKLRAFITILLIIGVLAGSASFVINRTFPGGSEHAGLLWLLAVVISLAGLLWMNRDEHER